MIVSNFRKNTRFRRCSNDDVGASSTEYAVLIGFIGLFVAATITFYGEQAESVWVRITDLLNSVL